MSTKKEAQGVTGRIPPQNIDAEISTLGALLLDQEAIMKVADFLHPTDFYRPENADIYEATLNLFEKRTPIDLVTVSEELGRMGKLELVGGPAKLSSLVSSVATATNVSHYGKIVREKAMLRKLIHAASDIGDLAFQDEMDTEHVLDKAESTLFGVTQRFLKQNFIPIRTILDDSFERLGMLANSDGALRGTPTGFRSLDRVLGGLQKSDLLIIAARPSMGKTTFAMNIAEHVAVEQKKVVGIFSLEMSKEQLVDRLISSMGRVDAWKLRNGQLSEEDMSNLIQAQAVLAEAPLYIDDAPMASVMEVRAKARRLQAEHPLELIVIDYLQLMQGSSKNQDNRVQEVSEISRSLKALAKELNCPVVALSQLSRAVEARNDKRPMLSDLRESGCLAGDTLITRADTGERVMIRDLVGKKDVLVWSLDDHFKLVKKHISRVFSSGYKQTYKLTFRSGRTIKASANHKFRNFSGWMRVDEMSEGQRLALPRSLDTDRHENRDYTRWHLQFLAHMVGDGCYVSRQPIHYTSADPENIAAVQLAAKKAFGISGRIVAQKSWFHLYLPSPYRLARGVRHPFITWLEAKGIGFARSYEKSLPDDLFTCSNMQLGFFLKHLWATDGSLTLQKSGVKIYYATTSPVLAEQVQHLLLRLGIHSTVRIVPQRKGEKVFRHSYHVDIQGKDNQMLFLEIVGCYGARGQDISELQSHLNSVIAHPNVDIVDPRIWKEMVQPAKDAITLSWRALQAEMGMQYSGSALFKSGMGRERLSRVAQAVKDPVLMDLAVSDVYWDEVVSITPLLIEEVFDATVTGTHNFIANDIVVHNSIEQDADVVMFLYRDDYYNKNKEEHDHLVEIIVSKHRNGPTGDVKLSSQFQYSRFYDIDLRK